ncbi:MAG: AAA family ATPase [Rhodospirillaceae bacterium]|nr:AAA family ATPase [Rhodospirillaceae bacterium]
MLMNRQPLALKVRQTFRLTADPFGELRGPEDLYVNADVRYVREAMFQAAVHDDFLAVTGESGSGKTTVRRDLIDRLEREGRMVKIIQPYVLGMEENDRKGKTLRVGHIVESILETLAPTERPRQSAQARFAQLHRALIASHEAGWRHCLIIEEAHCLPIPTLKHLKRLRELEKGYTKLLSIILIGQTELEDRLSPRNAEVREVAQRISMVRLTPIPAGEIAAYLAHRLGRAGAKLDDVIQPDAIEAIADRLTAVKARGAVEQSLLYPLAVGNLMTGALNLAAEYGETRITADVIRGV